MATLSGRPRQVQAANCLKLSSIGRGFSTDLGTFGGHSSCANAINDFGVVVGWADSPGDLSGDAFVDYGGGAIVDLNTLSSTRSLGWTIDDAVAVNLYRTDRG